MNNDGWNNGMGGGNWWWMAIIMFVVVGGLIWLAVTLLRRANPTSRPQTPAAAQTPPTIQTPQEVLAERLARGDIEPADYQQRLGALQHRSEEN
jgi:putative membrane protein